MTASPQGEAFPSLQKHLRRIHRAVTGLQNSGIAATVTREETPTHITITLTLPK